MKKNALYNIAIFLGGTVAVLWALVTVNDGGMRTDPGPALLLAILAEMGVYLLYMRLGELDPEEQRRQRAEMQALVTRANESSPLFGPRRRD